ncbi:hypothetical protein AUJ14_01785 [Candidatus Micrarchaeota archaeon CG1_02_55_22]|nr:MAG: hypothetical protein AUJ14_01785 [Candidatus Micrarchaeota archaeon CG1_02_55_22]
MPALAPFERLHEELGLPLPEKDELPHRKAYLSRLFSKHLTPRQKQAMQLWLGWHKGHPEAHGNYAQTGKAMGITATPATQKIQGSISKLTIVLRNEEAAAQSAETAYFNRRRP